MHKCQVHVVIRQQDLSRRCKQRCTRASPGVTLSQCLRTRTGNRVASRHSVSSVILRGPYRSFQECRLLRDAPAWTNTMFVGCKPIAVEMTK